MNKKVKGYIESIHMDLGMETVGHTDGSTTTVQVSAKKAEVRLILIEGDFGALVEQMYSGAPIEIEVGENNEQPKIKSKKFKSKWRMIEVGEEDGL